MADLGDVPLVEENDTANDNENGNVATNTTSTPTSAPTQDDPCECHDERDCIGATLRSVDVQQISCSRRSVAILAQGSSFDYVSPSGERCRACLEPVLLIECCRACLEPVLSDGSELQSYRWCCALVGRRRTYLTETGRNVGGQELVRIPR